MRKWLKDIRLVCKKTEKQVADAANIAQPFYHCIEAGMKNPSPQTAKRIAGVLDFDWTRFYEDKADGETEKAV